MLIRIWSDLHISWCRSGRNGRFNCGGSDTAISDNFFLILPTSLNERPHSQLEYHIRDLNNGNPASSKNPPGPILFGSPIQHREFIVFPNSILPSHLSTSTIFSHDRFSPWSMKDLDTGFSHLPPLTASFSSSSPLPPLSWDSAEQRLTRR